MDYTPIDYHKEMKAHYFRANCYHTMRDPDNDATSGNHHILNATHYLINRKLGLSESLPSEWDNEYDVAVSFIDSTYRNGWYMRHPQKINDRQAHDDSIGIIVTDKVFNGSMFVAGIMYVTGNNYTSGYVTKYKIPIKVKWYYTNLNDLPNLRVNAWFGRMPWLIALYKVGAGKKLNLFDKLAYTAYLLHTVYFNKDKSDTSGKILKWLGNYVMKGQSKMIDWAINKYERYIMEQYPDGYMGEVLGIYHGKTHPFSKVMWGRL